MSFRIQSASIGASLISDGTNEYLAINSSLKEKSLKAVDTVKLNSIPGIFIHNGVVQNWEVLGKTLIDNKIYFYGPPLSGKTLADSDLNQILIEKLCSAFSLLDETIYPIESFSLDAIFVTDSNEILFFPPLLVNFINSRRKESLNLQFIDPWNKEKLAYEEKISFTMAALIYHYITGENPFKGNSKREVELNKSLLNYKSPVLFKPKISEEIKEQMEISFKGKGKLSQWLNLCNKKSHDYWNSDLNDSDVEKRIIHEKKLDSLKTRRIGFYNKFNKNKTKIYTSMIGIVILSVFLIPPLSQLFKDPSTLGLSDMEVIQLYYDCFNSLDLKVFNDYIVNKVGKNDLNEISAVYITSKVRSSYEGEGQLVNPQEWESLLDDSKENVHLIWGVSDLEIIKGTDGTFEVFYKRWNSPVEFDKNQNKYISTNPKEIKDIIHLSFINKTWKIDSLARFPQN